MAVLAANLPFLTSKVFGLVPIRGQGAAKPAWIRITEFVILYIVVGLLGYAFETALVNPFPRGWEFYATTFCIFLVLGFPGFIYRYLLKG